MGELMLAFSSSRISTRATWLARTNSHCHLLCSSSPWPSSSARTGAGGPWASPSPGPSHRPRAEDRVRGPQEGRLHHAECRRGQPLREGVCVQLGGGVLHDGLDPDLLGRIHALEVNNLYLS